MKTLDDNYFTDYSNRYKIRIEDLTFDFAKNILFLSKDLTSVGREFGFQIFRFSVLNQILNFNQIPYFIL